MPLLALVGKKSAPIEYVMGETCAFCGARLTPNQMAYMLMFRISKLSACCKKLDTKYDIYDHNLVNLMQRMFSVPRSGTINFDSRVRYIISRLAHTSWVAVLLFTSVGATGNYTLMLDGNEVVLRTHTDEHIHKDTKGRLVRLVRKTLHPDLLAQIPDADFEQFHNMFMGEVLNTKFLWRVVQGEAIRDWYNEKTYADNCGQLNMSCMSHERAAPFLDLYVQNPKRIKLLTVQSPINRKLHGRALLWKTDQGIKYLDRPYANDILIPAIRQWAIDREFAYYGGTNQNLTVTVKNQHYERFPYLDTFSYYHRKKGILANYESLENMVMLDDDDGEYNEIAYDDGYYDDGY